MPDFIVESGITALLCVLCWVGMMLMKHFVAKSGVEKWLAIAPTLGLTQPRMGRADAPQPSSNFAGISDMLQPWFGERRGVPFYVTNRHVEVPGKGTH